MKKLISVFILALWLVLPAQAQEPYKVFLPVLLSSQFNRDNNWRIIQPVGSTNYVLNPSAEGTTNYAALAGTTVTLSTTYQKYGLYSYRVETNADNEGMTLTLSALANANHFVTMRVRGTLPAAWDWSLDNTVYTQPRLIEKIDGNWNLYGLHIQAAQANGSTTLYIRQRGAGLGDFYLDGIQVEPLDYWTTYIDGTQEGCAWNGTVHASTSTRSAASRAGGKSVDLLTEYNFQIQRVAGAGASTHSLSVDSYALLPGGELNNDKIQSRDFTITGKFIAETEADLLELKAALESAFYTNDNQLTRLRFNGGNVQKELAVRYRSGLEGDLAAFYGDVEIVEDAKLVEHEVYTEKVAIQVTAPYPFWQEVGESAAVLDTSDSATFRLVAARLKSTGQWDNLGPPAAPGTAVYTEVLAVAEDDIYIYFGGNFVNFDNIANADYIVRYNKQTGAYSALDVGLNQTVFTLTVGSDGKLYIGGAFTNAGGVADADYLTVWDGTNFSAVGVPNTGAASITFVLALKFDLSGNLYIGGSFTDWNNIAAADNIVMWDGTAYSALSTGANSSVNAITVGLDNSIYVGGGFTLAGGIANTVRIARWASGAWTALKTGANAGVTALATLVNGTIAVGGSFTTIGGNSANYIAIWNGTDFITLGSGLGNSSTSIVTDESMNIYTGGAFTTVGLSSVAQKIAKWNGSAWGHFDIDIPAGTPGVIKNLLISKYVDPVVKQKYDLYIGFDSSGTGTYGGKVVVNNEGTVIAFPKIVFNRSGGTTAVVETLRNEDNGRELLLEYSLLSGETLTIDLAPTQRSVVSSFFGPRPDAVLANSDFGSWALLPGNNNVTSYVATTGSPTVTAWMLWREAYSSY